MGRLESKRLVSSLCFPLTAKTYLFSSCLLTFILTVQQHVFSIMFLFCLFKRSCSVLHFHRVAIYRDDDDDVVVIVD